MIVDEMELMGGLRDVDPLPAEVSERAMQTLRTAMEMSKPLDALPIDAAARFRQVCRPRRLSAAVFGCAAVLIAVGVLSLTQGGGSSGPTSTQASPPPPTRPITGQTMRLASYAFQLPAGFSTAASACLALPAGLGPTIPARPGAGPLGATAASADGGCIEAVLVGRDARVPTGAEAVKLGPYTGFVSMSTPPSVDLYVAIPASRGHHGLVLAAEGLTANQLVAIAKSGLPSSLGPVQSCTANCG